MIGSAKVCVYIGEALAAYGFGHGHPFGTNRMAAFWDRARERGLDDLVCVREPVAASQADIELFHDHDYVEKVKALSATGRGFLDYGDTPAFVGVYAAAAYVVGAALDAADRLMAGECRFAFIPIAGLHHARRDGAAGFCVFNDCGVVMERLLGHHGLNRVFYVDIDAHHGDGVYYGFEDDPRVHIADIHEDGRYLYPGTGGADETGRGAARGTKHNFPLPPGAGDGDFMDAWTRVETLIERAEPEFILLQCGADSLAGDPITHLQLSARAHAHAAARLCHLAERYCPGRVLAAGGGGYNRRNLAEAWTGVLAAMIDAA
jgi:acetoin utilization protein AcuC